MGNEDRLEKINNRHARELVIWIIAHDKAPSSNSKDAFERSMFYFIRAYRSTIKYGKAEVKIYESSVNIINSYPHVLKYINNRSIGNKTLEEVHNEMTMDLVDFIWENKRLPKHISIIKPPPPSLEKRLREFLNQWKQAYRGGVKAKHYQSSYDIIVDAGLAEIVESKPLSVVRKIRAPNTKKKLPRTYFCK